MVFVRGMYLNSIFWKLYLWCLVEWNSLFFSIFFSVCINYIFLYFPKQISKLETEMSESAEIFHFGAKQKRGLKRIWQLWYKCTLKSTYSTIFIGEEQVTGCEHNLHKIPFHTALKHGQCKSKCSADSQSQATQNTICITICIVMKQKNPLFLSNP